MATEPNPEHEAAVAIVNAGIMATHNDSSMRFDPSSARDGALVAGANAEQAHVIAVELGAPDSRTSGALRGVLAFAAMKEQISG